VLRWVLGEFIPCRRFRRNMRERERERESILKYRVKSNGEKVFFSELDIILYNIPLFLKMSIFLSKKH
jgi:hypothetical protein